ncbi:MAG: hypothetical protein EBY16_08295 [Gammaproteobacteria bacterium]|nr:hypothetical protein [Gammaproteobacteria bacterium]
MQYFIHEGLERDVVNFTVKYLPDSDEIKQKCLLIQAHYHQAFTLLKQAKPNSENSARNEALVYCIQESI